MDGDPQMVAIVGAVARYLRVHPLASDTADGIACWWLGSDFATMEDVVRALDFMHRESLVEVIIAADGRLRYRRACIDSELDRVILAADVRGARH